MRTFTIIIWLGVMSSLASGQTLPGQDGDAKAREELRQLYTDYNEAGAKRDRAALEKLFADSYVWVQGNGSVTPKTKHIDNIIGNATPFSLPAPPFEQFSIYGDTAMFRSTERRAGLFATTVFVKTNGRWQFVHSQGTLLPPERKAVEVDPKVLDALVGSYEFGPGRLAKATKEGNALMWKGGGRPTVRLMPLSETHFFVEESGVEMTFNKNDKGETIGVTLRIGTCQDSQAKKVE